MGLTTALKRDAASQRIEWLKLLSIPLSSFARLFGCWHTEMSRPFTFSNESYRACLACGARRRFDIHSWKMTGPFYFAQPSGERRAVDA
jgi:hypothetical protein